MYHLNKLTEDHNTCMKYVLDKVYYNKLLQRLSHLRSKEIDFTLDDVVDAEKLYNISDRCYYIAQDILRITKRMQS